MSERELRPQAQHDLPTLQNCDMGQLASALEAEPEKTHDLAYGDGIGFRIGAHQAVRVELYPTSDIVRVASPHSRIELFRGIVPAAKADGVLFSQAHDEHHAKLGVAADGTLFYETAVLRITASPETTNGPLEASDFASGDNVHLRGSESLSANSTGFKAHSDESQGLSSGVSQSPTTGPEEEEKRRVSLTGRVGAAPSFRTTPKGVFIGRFPLAVHDAESTRWHTILTFNERTKKLQAAQLTKGQAVEVTGYVHERLQPHRDGKQNAVQEIYAVVIKAR